MGMCTFRCYLGFPIARTNAFSEQLEGRSVDLERHFRGANVDFMLACNSLHDAVDIALTADSGRTSRAVAQGLSLLASSNDHLTAIKRAIEDTRVDLFERERIDATDPLIARERYFAVIDYDEMRCELASHGAVLPDRVLWDNIAGLVRDGGATAGLRLIIDLVHQLQVKLCNFASAIEGMTSLPTLDMARALHDTSLAVAAQVMGFTRLLVTFTYFTMLCERASHIYEREFAVEQKIAAVA